MGPFPRKLPDHNVGKSIELIAGSHAHFRRIGITIAWDTVAAASEDLVFEDEVHIPQGTKYIRYGQPLVEITSGPHAGSFGPYDPAAEDGREDIDRGHTVLANATFTEDDELADFCPGGAVEGGLCWKDRILATDGTASLADGPTFANLEAALPLLRYA